VDTEVCRVTVTVTTLWRYTDGFTVIIIIVLLR